jgi:hypothetical protein
MNITKDQWDGIVAETRHSIDRWNASAGSHDLKDTFQCTLMPAGDYSMLVTTHRSGYRTDRKAVAYRAAADELKPAKITVKKGFASFKIQPAPKAWSALSGKSAAEIVKRLRLTDFLLVVSASLTAPPSGEPLRLVHGFHRKGHGRSVAMIVKEEDGQSAHQIAERIAGNDFCFHASTNISVDVPPECRGVLFEGDELYARVPELRPRVGAK